MKGINRRLRAVERQLEVRAEHQVSEPEAIVFLPRNGREVIGADWKPWRGTSGAVVSSDGRMVFYHSEQA